MVGDPRCMPCLCRYLKLAGRVLFSSSLSDCEGEGGREGGGREGRGEGRSEVQKVKISR